MAEVYTNDYVWAAIVFMIIILALLLLPGLINIIARLFGW